LAALLLRRYAQRQLFESGRLITICPMLGLLIGCLIASWFGATVTLELPNSRFIFPAARGHSGNSWR